MRNQMALYDKAIAIAKAPTDAAVNDKLNDMLTQSQNAKKIARTIQIPGADFTAAVDDDAAVSYLEKYVAKVKKDEEEKRQRKIRTSRFSLPTPAVRTCSTTISISLPMISTTI